MEDETKTESQEVEFRMTGKSEDVVKVMRARMARDAAGYMATAVVCVAILGTCGWAPGCNESIARSEASQ